jgi:hypothetical protein
MTDLDHTVIAVTAVHDQCVARLCDLTLQIRRHHVDCDQPDICPGERVAEALVGMPRLEMARLLTTALLELARPR